MPLSIINFFDELLSFYQFAICATEKCTYANKNTESFLHRFKTISMFLHFLRNLAMSNFIEKEFPKRMNVRIYTYFLYFATNGGYLFHKNSAE